MGVFVFVNVNVGVVRANKSDNLKLDEGIFNQFINLPKALI